MKYTQFMKQSMPKNPMKAKKQAPPLSPSTDSNHVAFFEQTYSSDPPEQFQEYALEDIISDPSMHTH